MKKTPEDVRSDPEAFRRQVRVPAMQVAGLTPEELSAALAYEVESYSGIPAAEADVALTPIADPDPEFRVYEVAVRRRSAAAGRGPLKAVRFLLFAAAAVAVLVVVDFMWMSFRVSSVGSEIARRAPLDMQVRSIERRAKANRDEAARLRAAREGEASAQRAAARLRGAYPALMDALARACGGRMVVREMSAKAPFTVEMRAVAVSAQDCAAALSALTRASESAGWRAFPGDIGTVDGGMAEFSCRFSFDATGASAKGGR